LANKHKKTNAPHFVMLEVKLLLNSEAYKSLKDSSVRIYIFLRSKTIGTLTSNGENDPINNEIKISYTLIEQDTGLSRQTVRNTIIELENKGFIDLVKQGGLKSFGCTSNVYRLSTRFFKYEQKELFKPGKIKKEKGLDDRGFTKVNKQKASIKTRPEQSNI
jgi:DNA-binding transcriptional ArsR family regulator